MATQYLEFTWRERTPGHWEREVDEVERFYSCLAKSFEGSGRMFFAITGFVSVSVPIPDSIPVHEVQASVDASIRKAWLRLRYEHPTIASKVHFDKELGKWMKTYESLHGTSSGNQAEQWLEKTFIPIETEMSGLEWCNSDPPAPHIPTLFAITPEYNKEDSKEVIRRDLVIRSPHDIIDGIGTLQLLNNLLGHAAQAYQQPLAWRSASLTNETSNLSPPLRVAASIPPHLNPAQDKRLKDIIKENTNLKSDVELLTIPFTKGKTVPGKHQRTVFELSDVATTQLLHAAKALGVTVTHIYHAAIVVFLRNLKARGPEPRTVRYISYGLVNERKRCKGEFATPKHAAAVYHSVSGESLAVDITVPSITDRWDQDESYCQEEFKKIVEHVKEYYSKIRNDTDAIALAPSFWSMGTPDVADPGSPITFVPPPNPSPSVSISSMGVLDSIIQSQHGVFQVRDPWVTGEELGTGLGAFLGSWQGKLSLSVAYNDAWHDLEQVDGFILSMQDIIWRGLRLQKSEGN